MAIVTASDTFDSEDLDPEVAEQIDPLIQWLNESMINVVSILSGGISGINLAAQYLETKGSAGVRNRVSTNRRVENVTLSRVVSQADGLVICTGFNWWPSAEGFDFAITFNETKENNIILKVEYNV
jgi:hypothetical protein